MSKKPFTKSAFKIALECPRRLFYAYDGTTYANQDSTDDFLKSLAEGGFQVGELAKVYYGIEGESNIDVLDHDEALAKTKELLKQKNINIAEAAFKSGNLFVRADILEKKGNDITIIEVKAKSWSPDDKYLGRGDVIKSDIRPYLYDVAFQKFVVMKALKELYPGKTFNVKARLMMADKSKAATVDGINQMFRICKSPDGRSYVEADKKACAALTEVPFNERVLTAFDVNDICDSIIAGTTGEQGDEKFMEGMKFQPFVELMSTHFCNRTKATTKLSKLCFQCPFHKKHDDKTKRLDGYKECWMEMAGFTEDDFEKPLIKDLSGQHIRKGDFIERGLYHMSELTYEHMAPSRNKTGDDGLDYLERKWLQIAVATDNKELQKGFGRFLNNGVYVDTDGLKKEMSKLKYPLHFIDFETSSVALPFYKGRKPYEQIAFQFSHHKLVKNEDGTFKITHEDQYINVKKGFFPNFEFVRELKKALETDEGSIFRYWTHENSILKAIRTQLEESSETDKDDLISFIDKITDDGERTMIDLGQYVIKYYYHPSMKGSNSIKFVLPAILNSSKMLQKKYSEAIYGTPKMPSLNLKEKVWIKYEEDGTTVKNPYKLLSSVASFLNIPEEEIDAMEMDENETIANGGAALAAYAKLQFSDMKISDALEKALLCYCELDTLAMVFIWEYFYDCCFNAR